MRVFHTNVSWLAFTGVWEITSPLRSPGLFSVFWSITKMLKSERSILHLISDSFNSLEIFFSFLVLWQGSSICQSFHFLWFSLSGLLVHQNLLNAKFFFLVNYHQVWSSGRDKVAIHLYLKIPEYFKRLIFSDGFCFVHKPFGSKYGQNSISCAILSWPPFSPSRASVVLFLC